MRKTEMCWFIILRIWLEIHQFVARFTVFFVSIRGRVKKFVEKEITIHRHYETISCTEK